MSDSLFKAPTVTPFVVCPNCKRLIEYGSKRCPGCHEEINEEYARASAMIVIQNTRACSLANTIKTAELGAVFVFLASLFGAYVAGPSLVIASLLTPVLGVAATISWFVRFGSFKLGDEEFAKAKRDMRNSLKLWVVLLAVMLLLITYLLKTGYQTL
jgi:RNA polymerase subunit RPABC4/transcription elongation factor Spt4